MKSISLSNIRNKMVLFKLRFTTNCTHLSHDLLFNHLNAKYFKRFSEYIQFARHLMCFVNLNKALF